MRKNLLLSLFILIYGAAQAQTETESQFQLGFKLSPTISTNRVSSESDSLSFDANGAGLRIALGPFVDFEFRENYYVNTGIFLVSKRSALEGTTKTTSKRYKEEYGLQYIQIPLSLKLYTNEVALDKKIYFQMGGSVDFNVNEKAKKESNVLIENFKLLDASIFLGFGLEYRLGLNTSVFGGFSYNRGLLNTVADQANVGDIILKNDYIGIDMGVKF